MALLWSIVFALCGGAITASATSRIVGGAATTIEKYPSLVQVEFLTQSNGQWSYNCGANILTSRFLLSAAQCFSGWDYNPSLRRIRAGATHRNGGGVIVGVVSAVNHPSYFQRGMEGDISVVTLMTPLSWSSTIQQGSIVAPGTILPDNLPVMIAGWGRSYPDYNMTVLRDVSVNTINNTLCAERYAEMSEFIHITKNLICFGVLDIGGRHASFDDVGGPMYYNNIIVGVISGGFDTGDGRYPSLSNAVASYTDWIIANAK